MPRSETGIEATDLHMRRVQLEFGDTRRIQPADATTVICNGVWVLPEPKLDAEVMHLPCLWAGDNGDRDPIHPDDRQAHIQKRMGWRPAKYLIILPYPTVQDASELVAMSPSSLSGALLREELISAGINLDDVVVSYVCRFPLPAYQKTYAQQQKGVCAPYVRADIQRIQPEVIITVGADALKTLFGSKAKLDTYRGNVLDYELGNKTYKVVPTVSHFQFIADKANISVFQSELRRAAQIAQQMWVAPHQQTEYRICRSVADVAQLCADIRAAAPPYIAFDTEWGNDVARNEHRYTLSVQLAWGKGKAAFIQLRTQDEVPSYVKSVPTGKQRKDGTYKTKDVMVKATRKCGLPMHTHDEEQAIWSMLQQLLLDKQWKLAGQHVRVDVEEFNRAGFPIDERIADAIDIMLVHHLLYGDEDQGLDHLVRKYVPSFGAFWMDLEEWLDANQRKARLYFGYRDIPTEILIPYALCDADASWQAVEPLMAELSAQQRLLQLYVNHVAPTSLHLLDVERHGILIDEEKRTELRDAYQPVYDDILDKLRVKISWPDFNPGSDHHKRSLLFSTTMYKEKKAAPADALVLALTPMYNTDKYPRPWDDVVKADEQRVSSPSTKAKVIELMTQQYPEVIELRYLKILSVLGKFLNSYLAAIELNEFGVPEDGKGVQNNIWLDGRVRTRLSQITETGRYTSQAANLQTKPKRQEAAALECLVFHKFGCPMREYEKRCKADYTGPDKIERKDQLAVPKFAACFIAREGYSLIEADFKTAELFIWAYCSGDVRLILVCDGGRDMHSEVAASAFKLEPERALEAIAAHARGDRKAYAEWASYFKQRYEAERTAAKACIFGIMYGRGAAALAREIMGQGVAIDAAGAQKIIDQVAADFPIAWKWLEGNAAYAIQHERLENIFGRLRYFSGSSRMFRGDQSKVGREAKNFNIQSAVADLLAQAGILLYQMLKRLGPQEMDMKILLPVHDAFLFEVKNEHVPKAFKLIKLCMSEMNLLPGTNHRLGVDIEVRAHSWGDKGYGESKLGEYMAKYVHKQQTASVN